MLALVLNYWFPRGHDYFIAFGKNAWNLIPRGGQGKSSSLTITLCRIIMMIKII